MQTVLGVALACLASTLFNAAIAIQALEARAVAPEHGLRFSLMGTLARRRRWRVGIAVQVLAFPIQTAALLLAPLTAVQPADAAGLLLLLYLGSRSLGERVGRTEILAVVSIVAGIVGLALAAPKRQVTHVEASEVWLPLAGVAIVALAPYAVRRWRGTGSRLVVVGAGFAFALSAFAMKLVADAISRNAWGALAVVLVVAVLGGALGVLSEQSALQLRQATQVAPIIFAIELLVPVLLAVTVVGRGTGASRRRGSPSALPWSRQEPSRSARTPTIAQLIASRAADEEVAARS